MTERKKGVRKESKEGKKRMYSGKQAEVNELSLSEIIILKMHAQFCQCTCNLIR